MKTLFNPSAQRLRRFTRLALSLTALAVPLAAQPNNRMPLAHPHVLDVLPTATKLARTVQMAATPLSITVMLEFSDRAAFDTYVKGFDDPASPDYHAVLTESEFAARFGPTQQAYDAVIAFLRQNGLTLVNGSANRQTMTAQGTRAQLEQAFAVAIDDYQLAGRTFHANSTEPTVPATLAPLIRALSGLNNLAVPRPVLSPTPAVPQSIARAYGAPGLPPGINGAGQTIALVEFDNFNPQDVLNWLQSAGLPANLFNQVRIFNINGGTSASNGKGTTEVLLDIDAVLGTAPGANVVVAVAPSGTTQIDAINSAFNAIRGAPGQSQGIISDSWGSCEREISDSDLDSLETLLQAIAIQGGSFFAAAGDSGLTCIGGDGTPYANRVSVPSAAPHAISVGGTTLNVTAGNVYQNESWWNNGLGSGGYGVSWHFGRPAWQAPFTSDSLRSVPDISTEADPNTAIGVCKGFNTTGPNCTLVGGTSLAAPIWASVWALSCQAKGTFPCGVSPESLYALPADTLRNPATLVGAGNDFAHLGRGTPVISTLAARVAGSPQIQSLNPSAGPLTGGTTVVIAGSFFIGVTGVSFGQTPALSWTVNSISQITAVAPAFADPDPNGSQHAVRVSVTTALGTFFSPLDVLFRYGLVVSGVSPNSGQITGGGAVTITGAGFVATRGTQIFFGDRESPNVYCYSSSSCVADLPASTSYGTVDVIAAAGGGVSVPTPSDRFTYLGPAITSISPSIGPESGGTQVNLYGVSLSDTFVFKFGNTVVKAGCFTSTWCEVFSPPGSGSANISVTYNGVQGAPTPATLFTWAKYPAVSGLVPNTGLATGGSVITIVGSDFNTVPGATKVSFGTTPAASVQCTATQCVVTTPPGTSTVDVAVSVNGLAAPKTPLDQFGFIPVVTGISPDNGPSNGGTSVRITGAGFASALLSSTTVTFGSAPGTITGCTAASCTALTPAGSGIVDVQITVDGHPSAKNTAARFTYKSVGTPKGWTQWQSPVDYTGQDVMTYDTIRHQALDVVQQVDDVGDSLSDETWTLDSTANTWTLRSLTTAPNVGAGALAFDPVRGNSVLFGGVWFVKRPTGIGTIPHVASGTWIWDGTTWTLATPAVHPAARVYANMAFDVARSRVVLFGGCADTRCTNVLNDTWTWDGVNWKQETPLSSPPARSNASMAYDPTLAKVVLFGGASAGNSLQGALGDMYAWDGQTWTQIHPATVPAARFGAGIGYSRTDSALVLFGGTGVTGDLPETWLWNGSAWAQAVTTPSPDHSSSISGMAYDPTHDATLLVSAGQLWTWGGQPTN